MSLTYAQKMALGAKRATYRRRLQEVLDAQDLSGAALARQLGISSVAVYRTLSGQLHSPKVLDWLRTHGAPEKYLCDPRTSDN
ncbi:hypothetical protein [Desulfovibrio legallii]|uniref:hypothetical protein n=1 Tax=Desulfovibrio legallii TaxID=571438 RepID=UPI000E4DBD32|nr:hypothetical protein [Desulfovibrio legallii]RHH23443.1 hypothetical protein DW219_06015 [Desulfovibrio sp. AM18-2]